MAEKKIKIGLVGIGRAGWGMHSREIEKYQDLYEVVAAMDPDAARLTEIAKRFKGCKTYQDFDKLLADKNVELVVVANRSPEHTPYALKAAQAGKYVFVEKPIALTYDDAKKLLAASKKYPGKIFCRHNRRFESAFNHIKQIIDSGLLGEVFLIKRRCHSFQRREDWQSIIDCGGGQLNNWGPHIIDQGVQFLDCKVKEVWGDLKKVEALGDAEDHVKIVLKGESGRVYDMEISGGVLFPEPVYTVYGTKGSLLLQSEGSKIQLKLLAEKQNFKHTISSRISPPITGAFGEPETVRFEERSFDLNPDWEVDIWSIYKYLFNTIRKGEKFPVKMEEAVEVVRITQVVKDMNPKFKTPDAEFVAKLDKIEKPACACAKKACAKKAPAKKAPAKKAAKK